MKKISCLGLAAIGLAIFTATPAAAQQKAKAPARVTTKTSVARGPYEDKIDALMKKMTLEEKIGQLNILSSDMDQTGSFFNPGYVNNIRQGKLGAVFNAYGYKNVMRLQKLAVDSTRLGIPLIFGYDVIHGHKTIFPMSLAEAGTWDLAAIEKGSRVAATEASAMGLDWTFAPMVDIARDPRWGRVMEGAGEDTWLGVQVAKARVRGFQGTKGLAATDAVMACTKHYAGYGAAQAGRDYSTTEISDRTLREVYLPPFQATVDAGVGTFMTAFNDLNGVPSTANKMLLDDILRKEWGFKGFVVTDYTAIWELLHHGNVTDSADAARKSIIAGADMDMQSSLYNIFLPEAVRSGKVPMSVIDESVRRILRKKYELGLFENPYRRMNQEREAKYVFNDENKAAARDVAKRSLVLLKNDNSTLPLKNANAKIALLGPLADAGGEMLGGWHGGGEPDKAVSLLTAMKGTWAGAAISVQKGCDVNTDNRSGFAAAIEAAKTADVVVLALGESDNMSAEAKSRSSIKLPGIQEEFLAEVRKATGKPIVVVLFNGRPLDLTAVVPNADAILEAWYPGTMAGWAVMDVLTGAYNPSGHLTMTFPRSIGQVPIFYNMKNTGRPGSVKDEYTSKYIDIPNDPLFPFGYGLSYTTFQYAKPELSKASMGMKNDSIRVRCAVQNTGSLAGEEVVQLYIRDLAGSVTRPVKELKGFKKVMIQPGQTTVVEFNLSANDLRFWDINMKYTAEPGKFHLWVAPNSAALGTPTNFEIK